MVNMHKKELLRVSRACEARIGTWMRSVKSAIIADSPVRTSISKSRRERLPADSPSTYRILEGLAGFHCGSLLECTGSARTRLPADTPDTRMRFRTTAMRKNTATYGPMYLEHENIHCSGVKKR